MRHVPAKPRTEGQLSGNEGHLKFGPFRHGRRITGTAQAKESYLTWKPWRGKAAVLLPLCFPTKKSPESRSMKPLARRKPKVEQLPAFRMIEGQNRNFIFGLTLHCNFFRGLSVLDSRAVDIGVQLGSSQMLAHAGRPPCSLQLQDWPNRSID